MTTPLWCLIFVAFMPYVLAVVGNVFRFREMGAIDNHAPRVQQSHMHGAGARIYAAQSNAWEALGFFTAAVLAAHLAQADPDASARAALVFAASRAVHPVCYAADWALMRSLVFVVGFGAWIALVRLAAVA